MMPLDLNLLRVLDVMLEERSVTRTGARLGLTQSAVSHSLNRLRYAVGDELFVRGPAGMEPTPRAMEMGRHVHAALLRLQAALAPADFSPADSDRRFALAAGAYVCAVLAPALVAHMGAEAPGTELAIAPHGPDVLDRLDAHRADFLIAGVLAAPARFARETLLHERLVWTVRAGHPLTRKRRIDLEALVSVPHVVIAAAATPGEEPGEPRGLVMRASWEDAGAFAAALANAGLPRRVGVSVPDSYSAIAVVARSQMATLVPRRLAALAAQSGRVALIEPPYHSPPVEISLVYLRERLADPAIAWMRDLVRSVAMNV